MPRVVSQTRRVDSSASDFDGSFGDAEHSAHFHRSRSVPGRRWRSTDSCRFRGSAPESTPAPSLSAVLQETFYALPAGLCVASVTAANTQCSGLAPPPRLRRRTCRKAAGRSRRRPPAAISFTPGMGWRIDAPRLIGDRRDGSKPAFFMPKLVANSCPMKDQRLYFLLVADAVLMDVGKSVWPRIHDLQAGSPIPLGTADKQIMAAMIAPTRVRVVSASSPARERDHETELPLLGYSSVKSADGRYLGGRDPRRCQDVAVIARGMAKLGGNRASRWSQPVALNERSLGFQLRPRASSRDRPIASLESDDAFGSFRRKAGAP